jgi:ArsR family transcriptional regulator
MTDKYTQNVVLFKALADKNRMQIVDILSCGEHCACELLDKFKITQPTLSHHMKILSDCGLVNARKDGKMTMYSLNSKSVESFKRCLCYITRNPDHCTCDEGCECKQVHL